MATEITPQRRREILDILTGLTCCCGAAKKTMMSHCRSCFFSLPGEQRRALYRRFGAGYEEAYEESLKTLGR